MTGDHPTDWALRHVKAQTLREAAGDLARAAGPQRVIDWLADRADELEQR